MWTRGRCSRAPTEAVCATAERPHVELFVWAASLAISQPQHRHELFSVVRVRVAMRMPLFGAMAMVMTVVVVAVAMAVALAAAVVVACAWP